MWKKFLKNNFLIYSILYLIIFIVIKLILNAISWEFMDWFYYLSYNLVLITAIIGIIQFIVKIKNKFLKIVLIILSIIIFIVVGYISFWIQAIIYKPTHIIVKDNKKMVVSEFYWDRIYTLTYYEYINPFIRSYDAIEEESLEHDPFENEENTVLKVWN